MPEWLGRGESRLRLQTIVRLRWLAVLGQSVTVIGA
jgi:two-component system sensor histidine kinase RegB